MGYAIPVPSHTVSCGAVAQSYYFPHFSPMRWGGAHVSGAGWRRCSITNFCCSKACPKYSDLVRGHWELWGV